MRIISESVQLQGIDLPEGTDVQLAVAQYEQSGLVEFAEANFLWFASVVPDDPQVDNFIRQGGHQTFMTGQILRPNGGEIIDG